MEKVNLLTAAAKRLERAMASLASCQKQLASKGKQLAGASKGK